jgi:transmembrane 9 superfamily protein 2/4
LNNHLRLVLKYHTEDEHHYRVVGFEVEPISINSADLKFQDSKCAWEAGKKYQPQEIKDNG